MSYSFSFTVRNKAEAKARITTEMAGVVSREPAHARDMPAAIAAGHAFVDMLVTDPTRDIAVSMYGSVSYTYDANAGGNADITGGGATISVSYVLRT